MCSNNWNKPVHSIYFNSVNLPNAYVVLDHYLTDYIFSLANSSMLKLIYDYSTHLFLIDILTV